MVVMTPHEESVDDTECRTRSQEDNVEVLRIVQ